MYKRPASTRFQGILYTALDLFFPLKYLFFSLLLFRFSSDLERNRRGCCFHWAPDFHPFLFSFWQLNSIHTRLHWIIDLPDFVTYLQRSYAIIYLYFDSISMIDIEKTEGHKLAGGCWSRLSPVSTLSLAYPLDTSTHFQPNQQKGK